MSNETRMRTERKTMIKGSAGRMVTTGFLLMLQVIWFLVILYRFSSYYAGIRIITEIIAIYIALRIYGRDSNAALKMPWLIVILSFPIFGLLIYVLFGRSLITNRVRKKIERIETSYKEELERDSEVIEKIKDIDLRTANEFRYLYNSGKFPVYDNTDVEFYSDAKEGIDAQIEELKKAKEFIFMEYHAIEDSESFDRLREVLSERAHAGVEVRVFYDDVGSIFFLNKQFIRDMRADGIDCRVFNPIKLAFNMFMNNRDHRKITIIDGKVGFTGGYNLADEYFNITHPYGHWKDTGIKLTGDAVKTLTMLFLSMWNSIKKSDEPEDDYIKYIDKSEFAYTGYLAKSDDTYVAPYGDNPLNSEHIAKNVYLNILRNAKKYVYITTPYLLITDDVVKELILSAKSGIDVRIVTPGIPDKKITYSMTRSYYSLLATEGVRIYEYTPGFIHAKQWVSDDEMSVVGTINMDYRSFYHHFEDAVLIYDKNVAADIKEDFENIFEESREVTEKYAEKSKKLNLSQSVLRLMAPLF